MSSCFLDYPSNEEWSECERWFEQQNESYTGLGSYLVSEQACALIGEVQVAFCAGAWLAVLVLTIAVVEAQLREIEFPDFRGNTKQLLTNAGVNKELQKLRERRNSIIHLDAMRPAITVEQQWSDRTQLESEARNAIRLMFETFYMSPGT